MSSELGQRRRASGAFGREASWIQKPELCRRTSAQPIGAFLCVSNYPLVVYCDQRKYSRKATKHFLSVGGPNLRAIHRDGVQVGNVCWRAQNLEESKTAPR